jgi:hypothetical protein
MKLLLVILGCCLLWVFCWPLLIVAIVLLPLLWLLSIPFRVVGIVVEAMLAFIRAILFLPARLLGGGRRLSARGL